MRSELADVVYPILSHGLDLRERLNHDESPSLFKEHATLERLLQGENPAWRASDPSTDQESRYALACWLDELLILDSPWAEQWNERKLELALFQSNDRAWKFWEQARRAQLRSDLDILEVYYLCVVLGFRGQLRNDPEKLRGWVEAAQEQLQAHKGPTWTDPPELGVLGDVPPLRGHSRLRFMAVICSLAGSALLALAALLAVWRWSR